MSDWPSCKAKRVRKALASIGWAEDPNDNKGGSHRKLIRAGFPNYIWAFDDSEELGPKILSRIAKHTGLKPSDL